MAVKTITAMCLVVAIICQFTTANAKGKPEINKEKSSVKKTNAKELSGISIVGNKEAPKSLFIIPWKSSETDVETSLTSKLLNENLTVIDKDVFELELDFYHAVNSE